MIHFLSIFHVGTIRATIIIETLPAAVDIEEMIYELREYCCGANSGRWDYIFSIIKRLQNKPEAVLPDRKQVRPQRQLAFGSTRD